MLKSVRALALIAMSSSAGTLAEGEPVRSRIMWADAPVIMDEHARGNWRREKRIWEENVYPIGNGRLGATVFGEPQQERIQFNEDSRWFGNADNTGRSQCLEEEAQLAVDGSTGKHPEFKGNVATVFSHPLSMGGTGAGHYEGNPETYMNVGEAMGKAMVGLLKK